MLTRVNKVYMYAKVFTQIFDSSIAEDYEVRHVFMDLLVLADCEGVVDMTAEAVSRRINVPMEMVVRALKVLSSSDPKSRSKESDGKRLELIDSHRDWGWRIINYEHYRQLRDEEGRRSYFRDYAAKRRKKVTPVHTSSHQITKSHQKSTKGEGEAEAEKKGKKKPTRLYPREIELKIKAKQEIANELHRRHTFEDSFGANWKDAAAKKQYDGLMGEIKQLRNDIANYQ